MRGHDTGDFLYYWHHDAVAELTVGLSIADGNLKSIWEAHETGTFPRCQTAWTSIVTLKNEDFGSVLMVSGRQCSGNTVRVCHAETEAVAYRLMFCCIGLEVVPKAGRQSVFFLNNLLFKVEKTVPIPREMGFGSIGFVENGSQFWPFFRQDQIVKGKGCFVLEPHDDDSFAVLGGEVPAVNDFVMHIISQLFSKRLQDYLEGIPLVMRYQVFYVLKHERTRSLCGNDSGDIKEKGPLGSAFKAVRPTKSVFLAHAGNAEWLAGKSPQKHVMVRDVLGRKHSDVTFKRVLVKEVCQVCGL